VWQAPHDAAPLGMCVVGIPALGGGVLPLWQETQVAPPRLLWSVLAPVHLVKLAVFAGVWQTSQAAVVTICVVGLPALGGGAVPMWQLEQAAPARLLWSTLAPVHLVKLAMVAGVWQTSHAAVVTTWVADLPALGAGLLPLWQLAQGVAPTTAWFITGPVHLV